MRTRAHAFTLVELLVVIAIMGILMSIIVPAVAGAQKSAREAQERKQLSDVNMAWKSWAASHRGGYPIPGLVRRQMKDLDGDGTGDEFVAGSGREDARWNTHNAMLSLCIMENLLVPEQLESPNEYSDIVYAHEAYKYGTLGQIDTDGATIKWDPGFSNDLTGERVGYAHNSYAIMPLAGERRRDQWDRTGSSAFAVLGTRGPMNGCATRLNPEAVDCDSNASVETSNSAYLMGKPGAWRGIIVFADGHNDLADGFYPDGSTWTSVDDVSGQTMELPDNVFRADAEAEGDWISDQTDLLGSDILLTHTDSDGDASSTRWSPQSEINPYDVEFEVLHD